jgi:hypothetical protein
MAIPPYNQGYPPDGSTLGQTKTTIRNNLDGTFLTLGVDHINNNGLPGTKPAGYHNVTHWVPQGADPATVAGYDQMYSKTVNGDQAMFLRTGNGIIQQLTTNVTPVAAANGVSFLPGGLIIQWGSVANPVTGTTVTFPLAFPNNIFSITLGPARPDTTSQALTIDSTVNPSENINFKLVTGSSAGGYKLCYWMAIGN